MNDDPTSPDAAQHISAASEERFIASTEEFASERSKATVLATNIIQACWSAASCCGCSMFRARLLNVSFYTEQLLAVTLGLTLALAFITEISRQPSAIDLGGLCGGRRRSIAYLRLSLLRAGRDFLADGRRARRRRRLDLDRQPRRLLALVRLALRRRFAAALPATSPCATRR